MNKERIIFTGGGSGGHVVPALTLIENIDKDLYEIHYIGSKSGIEANLTEGKVNFYHDIKVGKLRRYLSFQNLIDVFKVITGLIQAVFLIFRIKSKKSVVISMGGFVSVPVVIAAKLNGLKVYIHEQTTRVGLANKICSKFADKVMVSFEDSLKYFQGEKVIYTGYPVRKSFYSKDISHASIDGFEFKDTSKKLLFITGGGNGSLLINQSVKDVLGELKKNYKVVHQVGKNFIKEFEQYKDNDYLPVAFLGDEMPSLIKAADIIFSRSGAGTVCELMALKKKSIFIPLKIAQKNEQYHNAMEANRAFGSIVIEEDELKKTSLLNILSDFTPFQDEFTFDFQSSPTARILKECNLVLNQSI